MKKVILVLILFGACSLFTSCGLDDDGQNFHFTTLDIVEATVPDSFDLDETYTIEVTYLRPNSCTFFEGFDFAKPAETDRDIVAIGSVLTDETACTQEVEEVVATFEFNVIFTEDYHFRFFSGTDENDDATYIEYTIPVNVPN